MVLISFHGNDLSMLVRAEVTRGGRCPLPLPCAGIAKNVSNISFDPQISKIPQQKPGRILIPRALKRPANVQRRSLPTTPTTPTALRRKAQGLEPWAERHNIFGVDLNIVDSATEMICNGDSRNTAVPLTESSNRAGGFSVDNICLNKDSSPGECQATPLLDRIVASSRRVHSCCPGPNNRRCALCLHKNPY